MTTTQQRVAVELGERRYEILIEAGAIQRLGELVAPIIDGGRVLVVADETVARHHGDAVMRSLSAANVPAQQVTFVAGEPSKSIATCERLWQACADAGIDRAGCIIALGGGVCGDMAGFVSATWMRGIRFIQIPTTLLAMVDSSVGGKTGVNSAAGKNLIGAFQQPACVIIDPEVLGTMDQREYAAGLAEVLKYGVIHDAEFFAWQEAHAQALVARDPQAVTHVVATSCRIKAWYVENDEHEHGVRAHLNYGHTFGHALERDTAYQTYLHGEAVSIGMAMAADCAKRLGMLADDSLLPRQLALSAAYGLPVQHRCDGDRDATLERLMSAVRIDKKVRKGSTRFVLPRDFAQIEVVADPDPELIRAAFAAAMPEESSWNQ